MSFKKIGALFSLWVLCLNIAQSTTGFLVPFMPLLSHRLEKNLIMVLDVKQQEQFFGACGYTLAVALKDKIAPIIASKHALCFVESYFRPKEWFIYQHDNLLLFIPKNYLATHGIADPQQAGLDLNDWHELNLQYESISGSSFYTMLPDTRTGHETFENLSQYSTKIICNAFKKEKSNQWKIYAVGHGAPDSSQVCGLNLRDFQTLLDTLNQRITTDFFIYQTCFGGSKNQLREIYQLNQGSFKKFNYPIISGSLTNSVSFAASPTSDVSFKSIFLKVSQSIIKENKMRRLLKAVNELNKCLDLASQHHMSNNLLLIRLPNSEYFEPVADSKNVFKLSDWSQHNVYKQDPQRFKCFLIDKPIINATLDLQEANNFIVASGISRSKHFIKELKLPPITGTTEEILAKVSEFFCALIFPEKEKVFYIEHLIVGSHIFHQITITHEKRDRFFSRYQKFYVYALDDGTSSLYQGRIEFNMMYGLPTRTNSEVGIASEQKTRKYKIDYQKAVQKHLKKKHALPLYIEQEVFSIV